MPQMTFDLEDGQEPVSFSLSAADGKRFQAFMADCHDAVSDRKGLLDQQNAHIERIEKLEEELQAAKDYAEDRARLLDLIREKLGVPAEPHQSLDERVLIALTSPLNGWSLLSTPDNEAEERELFEKWYARKWSEDSGHQHTAAEIKKLRKPNGLYGDRGYLNGCWEGFKGAKGCQF
jgi:hypothetical protein